MKSSIPNAYEFSRLLLTHSPAHVLLSTLRGLISQAPTGKPICIGYVPVKQSVFLVSCSKYFLAVFCFSLFSIFNSISYAAEKPIGVVLAASGEVNVVRTKKTFALKRSERLFSGDRIITALNSRVQLKFVDRSIIALKQDSELSIDEFVFDAQAQQERSFYTLVRGGFRAVSGKIGKTDPADYAIKTPIATLGIRGTFYDAVLGDQLYVGVMNGKVAVENSQGELLVGVDAPFQYAAVGANQAPQGMKEAPQALANANTEFDPENTLEAEVKANQTSEETSDSESKQTDEEKTNEESTNEENNEEKSEESQTTNSTDADKQSNGATSESTSTEQATQTETTTKSSTPTSTSTTASIAAPPPTTTNTLTTNSEKTSVNTFANTFTTQTVLTESVFTGTKNEVQNTVTNTVVEKNVIQPTPMPTPVPTPVPTPAPTSVPVTFNSLFEKAAGSKTQGIMVRHTASTDAAPVIFSGQAIDTLENTTTFNLADRGQEWLAGTNTFALINFDNTAEFAADTINVSPHAELLLGAEAIKYSFGAVNQLQAVFSPNDLTQRTSLNATHHFIAGPTLGTNAFPVAGAYIYSVKLLHTDVPNALLYAAGPEFDSHLGQDIMIDTRTGIIDLDMHWQQRDPNDSTAFIHWNIKQEATLVDGSIRFVWDDNDVRTDGLTRQVCNSMGCSGYLAATGSMHIQLAGNKAETALGGFWFEDPLSAAGFSGIFGQRQDDRWSFFGMNTACTDFDNCTKDGFGILSQNPTWVDIDGSALPDKRLLRGSTIENGIDTNVHFYADDVGVYGAALTGTTLASDRFTQTLPTGVSIEWGKWTSSLAARLNPANPLEVQNTGTSGLWIRGPKTENDWFDANYQAAPTITHLTYTGPMLAGRLGAQPLNLTNSNLNLTINLMSASWYGDMELFSATQQLKAQMVGSVRQADLIGMGSFKVRENVLPGIDTHTGNLNLEAFLVGEDVEGLIGGFAGTANPIVGFANTGFNLEGIFAVSKTQSSTNIGGTLSFTGSAPIAGVQLLTQSIQTQRISAAPTPQPGNVEWGVWSSTTINSKFQVSATTFSQASQSKYWIFGTPTRFDYFNQAMSRGVTSLEYQGTAKLGSIGNENLTSSNFNMTIDLPSAQWGGQGNFASSTYQATVTVPVGSGSFTPVLSQFSAPNAQLNILNSMTNLTSTGTANWQGQVVGHQGEGVIGGITGRALPGGIGAPVDIQTVVQGIQVISP